MWHHKPHYGKIVWLFVSKDGFTNLSTLKYRVNKTTGRKDWETSGHSYRLAPDILGDWDAV